MAVELVESPMEVVFSRNPVFYGFRSDARYSNAGKVYRGGLDVVALGVSGQTLTLNFYGIEIIFTLAITPNASGLQLPAPLSGESLIDWCLRLRAAFKQNYYVQRYYTVSNTTSTDIIFIAKEANADFNISYSQNGSGFSFKAIQTGITKTLQPNFKLYVELFVKNKTGQFVSYVSSTLETDDNGYAYWDISRQLTSALLIDGHDRPNMAVPVWEISRRTIREFYVVYAEMYGSLQKVQRVYESDVKTAVYGGFSKGMLAERKFPDFFIIEGKNKWVSCFDGVDIIKPNQPVYANIVNLVEDYNFVSVKAKIYYSDNSEKVVALHDFPFWRKYDKIICPLGIQQNSLHLINEEKIITGFDVWFESLGQRISDLKQIRINYKFQPFTRFLLFENSYGCFQCLYTYGRKSNEYELIQKTAKLVSNKPFLLEDGESTVHSINLTDEEIVNSGFMTKRQIRGFRDFFLSSEKFTYKNKRYYPVMLNTMSIKEFEDGNNMFALEFSLQSLYNEELWTDEGEEEAYAYSPDLSGYIPAPPTIPENFDDRYYLKTETYNRGEIDNKLATMYGYVEGEINTMTDQYNELNLLLKNKAAIDHTHSDYATLTEVAEMVSDLSLFLGGWQQLTLEDDGYDEGVYVVHKNSIWLSKVPDNYVEPGFDGSWNAILIGGSGVFDDPSLLYDDNSNTLEDKFPDQRIGTIAFSDVNGVMWTKLAPKKWKVDSIEIK